jgi:hypothetical protein
MNTKLTLAVLLLVTALAIAPIATVEAGNRTLNDLHTTVQDDGFLPTIVEFSCDIDEISLAEAEAGQTIATFSWQTLGLTESHRLMLHIWYMDGWQPIDADAGGTQTLPAAGRLDVPIQHSLSFKPPTYRLIILNGDNQLLDEQTLVIHYSMPAPEDDEEAVPRPEIDTFAVGVDNIDIEELAAGQTRLLATWVIVHRTPSTNLVFEQLLEDGTAVSVELPREALWVSSEGEGTLAPILPENRVFVRLRLRLIDLQDERTIDAMIIKVPIEGSLDEEATP